MFKVLGVFTATCAVLMTAAPARADLTPAGPATLVPGGQVLCPTVFAPEVLLGWSVTVGEGGSAGTVRPRFPQGQDPVLGDPVQLPAEPGTYTFPAPRLSLQSCGYFPGLVQTTGGHAIVKPGGADRWLDLKRDGQPDARVDSAGLDLGLITEPDSDVDLLGDRTEDRTDLRVSLTSVVNLGARIASTVTVTNAGPLDADLLTLRVIRPDGFNGVWQHPCMVELCDAGRLAAGETRTFTFESDRPASGTVKILAGSEGPDLNAADNEAVLIDGPSSQPQATPPMTTTTVARTEVATARRQMLRRGVSVRLRGEGATRVTAAFKVRGRTIRIVRTVTLQAGIERSVTLRARGATLRTLRRAAARGTLRATITVRNTNGTATAATLVR